MCKRYAWVCGDGDGEDDDGGGNDGDGEDDDFPFLQDYWKHAWNALLFKFQDRQWGWVKGFWRARKIILNRAVRVIHAEKVKCEKDLKEVRGFAKWIFQSIPGRGKRKSKGPEMEVVMGDRR